MYNPEKRRRAAAAIVLMAAAAALILIPGLRSVSDGRETYQASGRIAETPEIEMPNGTISINEADADELTELYGIGETLAAMIIEEREKNGPYRYPEDLTAVKGIGLRKLEGFRDSINLDE